MESAATARGSSGSGTPDGAQEVQREALLIALTFAAGVVDAVSYLGLGQIFTANMTGNVVFLALAVGERNLPTALRSAVALISFGVGAVVAGQLLRRPRPAGVWPREVNWLLWGELTLLAIFGGIWLASAGQPGDELLYLLIALSAIALGLQNAAARHLAVPGLTTTVVTTTLTGLMVDLPALGIAGSAQRRAVWTVSTLFVGAAVGASFIVYARPFAPLVTVAAVGGVTLAAYWFFERARMVDP
jgi:uncharacterized membrane protein YoaK (UPF0700 family)